jgi:hypothetical protein
LTVDRRKKLEARGKTGKGRKKKGASGARKIYRSGAKHDRSQYEIITNNLYPVMLLQASKVRYTQEERRRKKKEERRKTEDRRRKRVDRGVICRKALG